MKYTISILCMLLFTGLSATSTLSETYQSDDAGSIIDSFVQTIDPSTSVWAAGQAKVTLRQADGSPANNIIVNFTTVNKNGGASRQPLTRSNVSALTVTESAVTNSNGEAIYNNNGAVPATLTITVTLASDSSKTASLDMQFGPALPLGFITGAVGRSGEWAWSTARNMCSALGGKLPLIKNSTSLASTTVSEGDPVEGIGIVGGAWPQNPALPAGSGYWTGTKVEDFGGFAWDVGLARGIRNSSYVYEVRVSTYANDRFNRVVCVP